MTKCYKASFINEKFAQEYLNKLKQTSVRLKKPKRAYLCEHCLNWHLTSSPEEKDDSVPDKRDKKIEGLENQIKNLNMQISVLVSKNNNQKKQIQNYYNIIQKLKKQQ